MRSATQDQRSHIGAGWDISQIYPIEYNSATFWNGCLSGTKCQMSERFDPQATDGPL